MTFQTGSKTFAGWKGKYGGLKVSEAQRLRHLEAENAKLKRVVADAWWPT